MPADSFVEIWKFVPRRKFSGSRHYAKPLGRYRQWRATAQRDNLPDKTENVETNR